MRRAAAAAQYQTFINEWQLSIIRWPAELTRELNHSIIHVTAAAAALYWVSAAWPVTWPWYSSRERSVTACESARAETSGRSWRCLDWRTTYNASVHCQRATRCDSVRLAFHAGRVLVQSHGRVAVVSPLCTYLHRPTRPDPTLHWMNSTKRSDHSNKFCSNRLNCV